MFQTLSSTSTQYLLVESTSFFSCKTSANRGAIYFNNQNNGQCVLYGVCGYDCCTTNSNSFQFGSIYIYNSVLNKNYVNYSSISRCINVNAYYVFELGCRNVSCSSVNMSMNKCYARTFYCYPISSSNSVTCSLTYSSFADNYATQCTCLFLWQNPVNFEIRSCNIIRNTQDSLGSEGTIATCGTLKIEDSCILENKATYTFYQGSSSYRLNLIIRNTATKSFINSKLSL
jgi:hypothetical protein